MSEDIDMIVPGHPSRYRKTNFERLNPIARSLEGFRSALSLELESFDGTRTDAGSHAIWDLNYDSKLLQPASITVEVSIRPLHRPARRVPLRQLLPESLVAGYGDAYCWALDFAEVRAEKVRAAFTRVDPQIRDYYDLGLLAAGGADMSSPPFRALVDAKLAEVGASSLSQQARSFGLDTHRREVLAASSKLLAGMVRSNEPPFNLDAVLAHYDALWA